MNDRGDGKVRGTVMSYFDSLERLMKPPVLYCVCGHSVAAHGPGPCGECACTAFSDEKKASGSPVEKGLNAGPHA